jgi:UDP-3-O-[3-hydroxymyristoyl] N-acetylglucosamine deacetylase/3-hydroxyacyl-[acyl-carrier-protein] dehydratase
MLSTSRRQRTIARDTEVRGVGFFTGADVRLRFRPDEPDRGIRFVRVDLPGRPRVAAHVRNVVHRQRRTTLQEGAAVVEMVEHVLAALAGLRIDNCLVEIDAAETPGCDGSSQAFVEAIRRAGIVEQDRPRPALTIDRPVTVREGPATLTAHPGDGERLVISYHLDYGPITPIGRQSLFLDLAPDTFERELGPSRTFLLEDEARVLRQAGIGRRATEADLLIFGAEGPIGNSLRFPDECVRHKLLDLVGDLALLGLDLVGHVVAHRSGHQLNAELVRKLLEAVEPCGSTAPAAAASDPVLDIQGIMRIVPHRFPFLLIDRVVELDPGKRVRALKNITYNEPFFPGHWPGRPIMPGVLILEAMAQASGIVISGWANPAEQEALIVGLDEVKIRRAVVPGDQLYLEVVTLRAKSRSAEMRASAWVGDQIAAEAKIRFVIVDTARAA